MARSCPDVSQRKVAVWVGSALRDLKEFPEAVREKIGYAISAAQHGGKHSDTKPWKGEGSGVFEVVTPHDGDTFRAVYLVRLAKAVYVLHAFQKKSTKGIKTSQSDKDLVKSRLADALAHYRENYDENKK